MSWEMRGGHLYYYQKSKVAGRVISKYLGCGSLAAAAAIKFEEDKKNKEYIRKQRKELLQVEAALNHEINPCCCLILALTEAVLLVCGYHSHKREWRKKK